MVKTGFFDYLDFALQFAPPMPEEKDIRAKLARIGVGAGKSINGWTLGGLAGGDSAFFHSDWLKRAAVAKAGICANDPVRSRRAFPDLRLTLRANILAREAP